MSLQPGINPLEKIHYSNIGRRRPPFVKDGPVYGPGPGQHYSFPTRDISAEEAMRKRTPPTEAEVLREKLIPAFKTLEYRPERDYREPKTLEYKYGRDESKPQLLGGSNVWGPGPGEMHRYQNTGGFDATDLMAKPEIKQEETRNQANMVSAPYEEANRKAAEKTNPMNAASQGSGYKFLMDYIGK